LTVWIFIEVQWRDTSVVSNAPWVTRQLSASEINSLTLAAPDGNLNWPPAGWLVDASRNSWNQGAHVHTTGELRSDMDGTSEDQPAPQPQPVAGEVFFQRYLRALVVQHQTFTASIQIADLGRVTATSIGGNNPQTMFSFQSTNPPRIFAHQLTRHGRRVFEDYGKNEWRGMTEYAWTVNGGFIPIKVEEIAFGFAASSVNHQALRFRDSFFGVVTTLSNRVSTLTPAQIVGPNMSGPREPHRQFSLQLNGLIRGYFFYDSHVSVALFIVDVRVRLIDVAGNVSDFLLSWRRDGDQPIIRDSW